MCRCHRPGEGRWQRGGVGRAPGQLGVAVLAVGQGGRVDGAVLAQVAVGAWAVVVVAVVVPVAVVTAVVVVAGEGVLVTGAGVCV